MTRTVFLAKNYAEGFQNILEICKKTFVISSSVYHKWNLKIQIFQNEKFDSTLHRAGSFP